VLTAIVISFAMTALFLVVLLASRLTGTDHVDGREPRNEAMTHLIAAPILLPLLTAAMLMLGEKHRPLKAKSTCSPASSAWSFR
jgi:hypothetical protein